MVVAAAPSQIEEQRNAGVVGVVGWGTMAKGAEQGVGLRVGPR